MDIIFAALLGLGAGFVSALTTGGGLLAIPGLIIMGLSPVGAIATSRLAAVSSGVSSSYRYHKSRQIVWHYMAYFVALAVLAGFIGPRLLITMNQTAVEKSVAWLMLAMLPLLLIQKDVGVMKKKRSQAVKAMGMALLFLVLLYATMFGGGSGVLFVYVLVYMFGLRVIQANATTSVLQLIGSLVALATFTRTGNVLFHVGIPLAIGALIGGYYGANMALHEKASWLKWALAAVIVVSSLMLLT